MTQPPITRDDLRLFAEDIKDHLGSRIDDLTVEVKEVKTEVKVTNGRVRQLEIDRAVQAQRTTAMEKEVFDRPRAVVPSQTDVAVTISKKQITTWLSLGIGAGAALSKIIPAIAQAMK